MACRPAPRRVGHVTPVAGWQNEKACKHPRPARVWSHWRQGPTPKVCHAQKARAILHAQARPYCRQSRPACADCKNQDAALTIPRSVLTATAMRNSELPPKDTRLLSVRRACRAGLANPFSCSTAECSASVWMRQPYNPATAKYQSSWVSSGSQQWIACSTAEGLMSHWTAAQPILPSDVCRGCPSGCPFCFLKEEEVWRRCVGCPSVCHFFLGKAPVFSRSCSLGCPLC